MKQAAAREFADDTGQTGATLTQPSAGPGGNRRAIGRGALGLLAATLVGTVSASLVRRQGVTSAPATADLVSQRRAGLTGPVTYVALGASDSVGYGTESPAREGWVPLLAERLPSGSRLMNLGVPGITLRRTVQDVLPRALSARPHLVTIWLVVNDVLEGVPVDQYRADLDLLLTQLRQETPAHVAVGNLPEPPSTVGGFELPGLVQQALVGTWNQAIADAVNRHQAILVDLQRDWPVARHPEYVSADGFHPTAVGYSALAEVFAGTLLAHGVL